MTLSCCQISSFGSEELSQKDLGPVFALRPAKDPLAIASSFRQADRQSSSHSALSGLARVRPCCYGAFFDYVFVT